MNQQPQGPPAPAAYPGFGQGRAGGAGGALAPLFVRTVPPVSVVKPPTGNDFVKYTTTATVNAANSPFVVASYAVPDGSTGFLRSFELQVQNVLATSDIVWAIRIDRIPVPGLGAIPVLAAVIPVWSQDWSSDEVFLEIPPASTLDLVVTVNDGAAYAIGGLFHGWIVPTSIAQASRQGWLT